MKNLLVQTEFTLLLQHNFSGLSIKQPACIGLFLILRPDSFRQNFRIAENQRIFCRIAPFMPEHTGLPAFSALLSSNYLDSKGAK